MTVTSITPWVTEYNTLGPIRTQNVHRPLQKESSQNNYCHLKEEGLGYDQAIDYFAGRFTR
jgi:hypothetical protein